MENSQQNKGRALGSLIYQCSSVGLIGTFSSVNIYVDRYTLISHVFHARLVNCRFSEQETIKLFSRIFPRNLAFPQYALQCYFRIR